jgi:hypothetical protein
MIKITYRDNNQRGGLLSKIMRKSMNFMKELDWDKIHKLASLRDKLKDSTTDNLFNKSHPLEITKKAKDP